MTRHETRTPAGPAALWRCLLAEATGTGALVAVVVGSGIAAARLSPNDVGLQLLQNSSATVLGLAVLIAVLGPVSGAHLNPVVSLVDWVLSRAAGRAPEERGAAPSGARVVAYCGAQVLGGLVGVVLANAMFDLPPVQVSQTHRVSLGQLVAEVVATAGLVAVVVSLTRTGRARLAPMAVAAWIGAAYWFTSSTAFANPAVTLARALSDTFAGISPASAAAFIPAQLLGGALGAALAVALTPAPRTASENNTALKENLR